MSDSHGRHFTQHWIMLQIGVIPMPPARKTVGAKLSSTGSRSWGPRWVNTHADPRIRVKPARAASAAGVELDRNCELFRLLSRVDRGEYDRLTPIGNSMSTLAPGSTRKCTAIFRRLELIDVHALRRVADRREAHASVPVRALTTAWASCVNTACRPRRGLSEMIHALPTTGSGSPT